MKIHKKILIAILILLVITLVPHGIVNAIDPESITGKEDIESEIDLGFIDSAQDMIGTVAGVASVGILLIIAIRYMVGSVEEKAQYKKSMMPYVIGCILVFGAALLVPKLIDIVNNETVTDGKTVQDFGNEILGYIQYAGIIIAVIIIMILGVKYMTGTVEQRAGYKSSMVPYIIGVVILAGAVVFARMIANVVTQTIEGKTEEKETETAIVIDIDEETKLI